MLLNLDKPNKTATLHSGVACPSVPKPYGTDRKQVGAMGRDGGWFEVRSDDEAVRMAQRHLPAAEFRRCTKC
jgi:hypothetical protein